VLTLRRSILTEKVARRGYHLSREYAVDPLEIIFVREVMRTNIVALPADMSLQDLAESIRTDHRRSQRLFPVVDGIRHLVGVLTRADAQKALDDPAANNGARSVGEIARASPVEAYPDEPLRVVVYRMAEKGVTRMPVVESNGSRRLLGTITLEDLLVARVRNLEDERRRKRILPLQLSFPRTRSMVT
jgi:CBS domain-containing protein